MKKKAFRVITVLSMAVTGCAAQPQPTINPEITPSPITNNIDPVIIPGLLPLTEIDPTEPFQIVPTHRYSPLPTYENTKPAPTETAIPSWEERMQEAKSQENAQLIPTKEWGSYAKRIGTPASTIYTAVEYHRKILRTQGLTVDDFEFYLAADKADEKDWVVMVRDKNTGAMFWSVGGDNSNSFNTRPDISVSTTLDPKQTLRPIQPPQHGEDMALVFLNGEVFAFYQNTEGRKTAVFNQEPGRVTRWEDTLYWKGAEALQELDGVEFAVTDGVNRIALDKQGNILGKLEVGRDRWAYTQEGLNAIVPSDEEIKEFFDGNVDMRSYTTIDNIVFEDTGRVKAIGLLNVIIYNSPILAILPGKELVLDNGRSMGNVYVLTPSIAKWRGKGGEEKYYHLFFNSGIENFSMISIAPGVRETLNLESDVMQSVFEVGGTRTINSYVGYNFTDIPPGWTSNSHQEATKDPQTGRLIWRSLTAEESNKLAKKTYEDGYPGILPMTDLFGSSSYDILMNHIKLGKVLEGSIIIGPTNGVDIR